MDSEQYNYVHGRLAVNIDDPPAILKFNTGKVLNQIYLNGGRVRIVSLSVLCRIKSVGDVAAIVSHTKETSSPIGSNNTFAGLFAGGEIPAYGGGDLELLSNFAFYVPRGWYYLVTTTLVGTGSSSITFWHEVDL